MYEIARMNSQMYLIGKYFCHTNLIFIINSHLNSLINLEETLDQDLDAILGELCALENNFGDGDPDMSRDSDTSSKASKASSTISSSSTVVQVVRPSTTAVPSNVSSHSTTPDKPTRLANPVKNNVPGK